MPAGRSAPGSRGPAPPDRPAPPSTAHVPAHPAYPYEHRTHGLLSWPRFLRRAARHVLWAAIVVAVAVAVGTAGYHWFGGLGWIDAFLNASMIMSGEGPVDRMVSNGGKLFAAFYALFSGLLLIVVMGVILTPWVHRLMHWMHLEQR